MRRSYERDELSEDQASSAPTELFGRWFATATERYSGEANAMTIATVGADGRPSTRVVLMKALEDGCPVFYTNYNSRKGTELAANPYAAAQFFWPDLEQVVRIEGKVEKVTEDTSDAYYKQRPLDSRLGAWASPQSQPINSRMELVTGATAAAAKHGFNPPRPPWWGGYRLIPDYWEFWQGRKSRLHDRICYQLVDGDWQRQRLAP